jgi:hypothetical protein
MATPAGNGGDICNPSTLETEEGGLRVQGQPGLHRETLTHISNQGADRVAQVAEGIPSKHEALSSSSSTTKTKTTAKNNPKQNLKTPQKQSGHTKSKL